MTELKPIELEGYKDCELGKHKGECCQECIYSGERLCCECKELCKQ